MPVILDCQNIFVGIGVQYKRFEKCAVWFGAADEAAEVIYTPRVILIKAMNIMIIKKREWVF